jgi:hypothetical protein
VATTTPVDRPLHLAGERAPFAMLPRWLLYHPDVGEGAKFLYCVLHDLVSGRQGPTRPVTRAELATCCGVSVDTIDRRLAQLVAVRAVEKNAQIRAGGQQANVYQVWLTPPEGLHRGGGEGEVPRGRTVAAPVEGSANRQVSHSRTVAAPPVEPQDCGSAYRTDAAPNEKEEEERIPPQPPRPAGGQGEFQSDTTATAGRRSSRAAGTNPRSEAERAEAERLEKEAARRQAELELTTQARRAADLAAEREAERLEAEAHSISAALDDATLCAVVAQASAGLSGLLAGSTVAVTRAVVAWCCTANATFPVPFADAVAAGLRDGMAAGEGHAPLDLPSAPLDTVPLRTRIAAILKARGAV